MNEQSDNGAGVRHHRSPAYPAISLAAALGRAKQFYGPQRDRSAPVTAALEMWGFKPKSGSGGVTVAALKQFGFMTETGSGDLRKVQLTDLALRIIRDEREPSPERDQLIKQAALTPKIYGEMWQEWGASLPAEATIKFFLIQEKNYNEASVPQLILDYKDTIVFAKLGDSDKLAAPEGERSTSDGDTGKPEKVLNPPPPPVSGVKLMEGERVVFTHEIEPAHGVRILASGEVDESLLDALEVFVELQKKRLGRQKPNSRSVNEPLGSE